MSNTRSTSTVTLILRLIVLSTIRIFASPNLALSVSDAELCFQSETASLAVDYRQRGA